MDGFTQVVASMPTEALFFILLIAALTISLNVRFTSRGASLGPTVLTMVGIFGCFFGIATGLLRFDPSDVQTGVPALVQGIKTSFWVSVAGIAGALLLKFRILWRGVPQPESKGVYEDATAADIANLLKQLNRALIGDEDQTLLSQIKLMRQDQNDRLERMQRSFESFAEKVSELGSKALIKALEEVIRDFNTKLTEQFGENFKHLNHAVEQLVVWQKQYRDQMNMLIEQETATRKSMTEAAARFGEMVHRSEAFGKVAERLSTLLEALNTQRAQLEHSMSQLAQLFAKASDGLPRIEKQIVETAQLMESGVRTSAGIVQQAMEIATKNLSRAQTEMQTAMLDGVRKANESIGSHVRQLSEDTKKQVVALNTGMERALTQSLESLGKQLTALSQRFVEDYVPLVEQLRKLTRVAERV